MCSKCNEIEKDIERYQRLRSEVTEPLAVELINIIIEEFVSEKRSLHSRDDKILPD